MVDAQADEGERCERMTRELASQLLELMDGLCETEQGRLAVAVLKYIATGEMKEPRGTERAFFTKACEMVDVQMHKDDVQMRNIYINTNNTLSQVSTKGTQNITTFDTFWNTYPSKVNKKRCMDLWKKLNPDDDLVQKMLKSIEAWKRTRQWREGYIPYPDTWLRGEKWNDEVPDEPKPKSKNPFNNYKQRPPMSEDEFNALCLNLNEELEP